MPPSELTNSSIALCMGAAALIAPAQVSAKWRFSAYSGFGETAEGDLRLSRPGGVDLTFKDVPWEGESLESPLYYGLRATYWFETKPSFGLGLDFTHAKMVVSSSDVVEVRGARAGAEVAAQEPIGATFQNLQISPPAPTITVSVAPRSAARMRLVDAPPAPPSPPPRSTASALQPPPDTGRRARRARRAVIVREFTSERRSVRLGESQVRPRAISPKSLPRDACGEVGSPPRLSVAGRKPVAQDPETSAPMIVHLGMLQGCITAVSEVIAEAKVTASLDR